MEQEDYNNEPKYGPAIASFIILFIVIGSTSYLTYNEIVRQDEAENNIKIINEIISIDNTVTTEEINIIRSLDENNLTEEEINRILNELDAQDQDFKDQVIQDTKNLLEN